jgi:ABC-type molybdate transport system substrate-binding protein
VTPAARRHELACVPIAVAVRAGTPRPGLAVAGLLPALLQRRIADAAGVVAASPAREAAEAFVALVAGPEGRARLREVGVETPEAAR